LSGACSPGTAHSLGRRTTPSCSAWERWAQSARLALRGYGGAGEVGIRRSIRRSISARRGAPALGGRLSEGGRRSSEPGIARAANFPTWDGTSKRWKVCGGCFPDVGRFRTRFSRHWKAVSNDWRDSSGGRKPKATVLPVKGSGIPLTPGRRLRAGGRTRSGTGCPTDRHSARRMKGEARRGPAAEGGSGSAAARPGLPGREFAARRPGLTGVRE